MFEKKKREPDAKFDAKMEVLEKLRNMAKEMMGSELTAPKEMKQVSVAAPDKESLEEGLSMASELMDQAPDDEELKDEMEAEEEDPAELDRQIAELMARKAALEQKG